MTVPGKDGCAAAVSAAAGLIMFRDKTKRGFYDHTLSPGCILLFLDKNFVPDKKKRETLRVDLLCGFVLKTPRNPGPQTLLASL